MRSITICVWVNYDETVLGETEVLDSVCPIIELAIREKANPAVSLSEIGAPEWAQHEEEAG